MQVLVFMSEIKFDLTLKISNLLFRLHFYSQEIYFLSTLRHLRREINLFPASSRQLGLVQRIQGHIIG